MNLVIWEPFLNVFINSPIISFSSYSPPHRKDYQTTQLIPGLLQLAPHTHLVLDETQLLEGRLTEHGLQSIAALTAVIQRQQTPADFQFYRLDYDADISVLCLSEGRSMLPSQCHVRLRPADAAAVAEVRERIAAARHFLQPKLAGLRRQLTRCKLQEFVIDDAAMAMITQDYERMRKANLQTVRAECLHGLLLLARLLGVAEGERRLGESVWRRAMRMEAERKERVA